MRRTLLILSLALFLAGGNLSAQSNAEPSLKVSLNPCTLFSGSLAAGALGADSNLHLLTATMTDCGCELLTAVVFPFDQQWVCVANFSSVEPLQHFSSAAPASIQAEIEGQALGQCSDLQPLLPRKVRMLFWLDGGGPDFTLGIFRSSIHGYYLIDKGAIALP